MKFPSAPESVVRFTRVSVFNNVIFEPLRALPCESLTLPLTLALCAKRGRLRQLTRRNTTARNINRISLPLQRPVPLSSSEKSDERIVISRTLCPHKALWSTTLNRTGAGGIKSFAASFRGCCRSETSRVLQRNIEKV
jgi:hypothetical protein